MADQPVPVGSDCSLSMTGAKKDAVGRYITQVGPELRRQYGKRTHYSPEQVRRTIESQALPIDYACFAYCLFCSPEDFLLLHTAAGEACEYGAMRALVGETFFTGGTDFDLGTAGELLDGGASLTEGIDLIGGLSDGVGALLSGFLDAIASASP